jgi:hypothetical protein
MLGQCVTCLSTHKCVMLGLCVTCLSTNKNVMLGQCVTCLSTHKCVRRRCGNYIGLAQSWLVENKLHRNYVDISNFRQKYSSVKTVAHCTLHTAHCTLHTAHCTLHTAHCTLHIAHCTLHTAHCTLHTAHYGNKCATKIIFVVFCIVFCKSGHVTG